jgi:nitroimidazol reductase NimA-like FMN-containing flavoprotein (pyridoxamine 5'-phosphate oxidase superfamily)
LAQRTDVEEGAVSLAMTTAEREAFLADVHVGVLGVEADGRGPLTVPIWYAYEPGGLVSIITAPTSQKARLIDRAGRFSLCAQTETAPYKYASVEGPVAAVDSPVEREERKALAYRYLGREFGDMYMEATESDAADSVVIRMRPERWLTTDYAKQFG